MLMLVKMHHNGHAHACKNVCPSSAHLLWHAHACKNVCLCWSACVFFLYNNIPSQFCHNHMDLLRTIVSSPLCCFASSSLTNDLFMYVFQGSILLATISSIKWQPFGQSNPANGILCGVSIAWWTVLAEFGFKRSATNSRMLHATRGCFPA